MSAELTPQERELVGRLLEAVPAMTGAELLQAYIAAEVRAHAAERGLDVSRAEAAAAKDELRAANAAGEFACGQWKKCREALAAVVRRAEVAEARAAWLQAEFDAYDAEPGQPYADAKRRAFECKTKLRALSAAVDGEVVR